MRLLVLATASVVAFQLFSAQLFSAGPFSVAGAQAQDNRDVRPLLDRLDRLERDMNQLQRQVYRGGSSGAPVPVPQADGSSAVNTELRLDQLDAQIRSITGHVEEVANNVEQLK